MREREKDDSALVWVTGKHVQVTYLIILLSDQPSERPIKTSQFVFAHVFG